MFRSIRWRLQAWYALLLLLVVCGFGGVLFWQVQRSRFDEVDAELQAAAHTLEGALRGLPPHLFEDREDGPEAHPRDRPPRPKRPPPPGQGPERPPPPPFPRDDRFERRPPDRRPPDPPRDRIDQVLTLPPHFQHRPGLDQPFYFAIWVADGRLLRASPGANVPPPGPPPPGEPRPYWIRQRGANRELTLFGPHGATILVGRQIAGELAGLARLVWQLLITGLILWTAGLAGGWVLSGRVLRPLLHMTRTAATISAASLSQRIDTTGVDSELGELARVLNETFSRLETAFQQQVRFTADASHELRTPLAVIHSQAELALARMRSPEEYREALDACLRAARRMRSLVEALLTLARADAGKLEMTPRPVDLSAIVQSSVRLLEPLAAQKKIALRLDLRPLQVHGDADRLSQVVTNLLTNAINYNHSGGEVRLVLDLQNEDAVLSVADTGCGIPAEDQPRIFDRFYRVNRARSRDAGGSGLGLAICKSIVEAHGGVITLTSQVGKGATFRVALPLFDRVRRRIRTGPRER